MRLEDEKRGGEPAGTTRSAERHLASRLTILLLLLLPFVILKLSFSPGDGPYGADAAYYVQIARNVAEGEGYVTSVSLYHQAIRELPAPAAFPPLWPSSLGLVAGLVGLEVAVNTVPRLLYFVALVVLYLLSNELARRLGRDPIVFHRLRLDHGHFAVLLMASAPMFFFSTTFPYTEGLAFLLAFGSLYASSRFGSNRKLVWGLATALLAVLALLTRTQMIVLVGSVGIAVALDAVFRKRITATIVLMLAVLSVGYAAHHVVTQESPGSDPEIESFAMWVEPDSALDWVAERVEGMAVSMQIGGEYSYWRLFGPSIFLPPFALMLFLWRGRDLLHLGSWRDQEYPGLLPVSAMVLTGLGSFAALNLFHATFFLPWLFGWRHGLAYIFLIIPSLLYLAGGRNGRLVVAALVIASSAMGVVSIGKFTYGPHEGRTVAEKQFRNWVSENAMEDSVFLSTRAQELAALTGANFHWTLCGESAGFTRSMVERLPIDYVVVYRSELRCSFVDREVLDDRLEPRIWFGSGPEAILLLEVIDRPAQ